MRSHRVVSRLVFPIAAAIALAAALPAAARQDDDGALVYAGTYTGGDSRGIHAFRFDEETGALRPIGLAAETPNPSFLTASRDGRVLFAVNEGRRYNGEASGSVSSFAIDPSTGKLRRISVQASHGTDPCHLALDATGRYLAVANYTSGTFAVFPVTADGAIEPPIAVLTHEGSGPHRRQAGPHAHQVLFDATNKYLFAVDLGLDAIFVYRFDADRGTVAPADPAAVRVAPGAGPRHLVLDTGSPRAFVIAELDSTITPLVWYADRATFDVGRAVSTLPSGFTGSSSTAEIALSPDGRTLYGSNRGHDSLAIFRVGDDGTLAPSGHEPTRGRTPRHFTLSPSGRWLLAANQDSNTIAVFRVDAATGALAPAGPLTPAASPVCLLFVPASGR